MEAVYYSVPYTAVVRFRMGLHTVAVLILRQGGGERSLHPELFADALDVIWEFSRMKCMWYLLNACHVMCGAYDMPRTWQGTQEVYG